jgi:hypothetical protein
MQMETNIGFKSDRVQAKKTTFKSNNNPNLNSNMMNLADAFKKEISIEERLAEPPSPVIR